MEELVAALFGIVMSLVFTFMPKLKEWWAKQEYQREITLGFFQLAPFLIYGLSCGGLDYKDVICPPNAFKSAEFYYDGLRAGFSAFVGSQMAFTAVKRGKKLSS